MKVYNCLLVIVLIVILSTITGQAQTTIKFDHTNRGHREYRDVLVLQSKSAKVPQDTLDKQKEEIKPVEAMIGLHETKIYPNPTKGMLRIDLPRLNDLEALITVHDASGKLIIRKSSNGPGNSVDLSAYPNGFYIMKICIGQDKKEWKIIKE